MRQFKPLKKILEDNDIEKGDLIFIREVDKKENYFEGTPVFYVSEGEYIIESQNKRYYGIRVATSMLDGGYSSNLHLNTVFHNEEHGTLLPFNGDGNYEYCLLLKKRELPTIESKKRIKVKEKVSK